MNSGLALINCSNLHNGGGVQVAVSFIYELSKIPDIDLSYIHIVVSDEVNLGLERLNAKCSRFCKYEVLNTYGIKALNSNLNKRIKDYALVFTVFGPNYLRAQANKEVVGFAQPWILNFDNPISRSMTFINRNKLKFKFMLQSLFFLRSDHYVVELEHVKKSLNTSMKIANQNISVVHNTVSSIYNDSSKWSNIEFIRGSEDLALGIVTRDYPHKNLGILPNVAEILKLNYGIDIHFYTTLNEDEWLTKNSFFKEYVSTVGTLTPDQCPSFYQKIDGVIFPSLLECFSATPLEAMVMKKPLFASDRDFVRDVCKEYAIYFDPLNANDIASKIAIYFNSTKYDEIQLQEAKEYALNFSSAENRAKKYLEIINNYI